MQTFLPYADFDKSAACLDTKRLGKQRVETKQILNALLGKSKGWVNHPATKMWRGHEIALAVYGIAICEEWRKRGYKDNLLPFFEAFLKEEGNKRTKKPPSWLGREDVHASHRANLIRKDYDFYVFCGWKDDSTLPYVWPTP
jgi:hypothetical protein